MKFFFYIFSSIFIFLEFIFILTFFFETEISSHEFFIYEFFTFFIINFLFNINLYEHSHNKEDFDKNDINIDIIFKFCLILIKTPSFFLNYFLNIAKKIFHYLVYFKYRLLINFTKIYYKKNFCNFFILWKPLFKKTSYFGYYRSNRSKWIK